MDTTLLLLLGVIGFLLWMLTCKPTNYPPGPTKWPLVGNILELRGRLIHESMRNLADKYGGFVGFFIGSQPVVLISDLAIAKEATGKDELAGRPVSHLALQLGRGRIYGLILPQGNVWREQRRFALRHLRDLGFGKHSMEGLIQEEINALFGEVDRLAGPDSKCPVEICTLLGISIVNILWHVIAGQRYEHGDIRLKRLLTISKELLTVTDAAGGFAQNFPWLVKFLPFLSEKQTIVNVRENVYKFVRPDLAKHKSTLDRDNPRDFLDMFLIEMENQADNPDTSFLEQQILDICKDLFVAGSDTTFNSLSFSLAYMMNYPSVQEKVQQELDRVVGQDRLPSLDDRPNLVYTEATLQEIMRMSSVVPLSVPHAPLAHERDVTLRNYVIPKDSRVLINIAYIHMDPKLWGDPENFRPERFISEEGKLLKPEALMPFGTGKRQCLGEPLARNNFFLIFTAFLQRYTLEAALGDKAPSLAPTGGFTIAPNPFSAVMTPRFTVS